MNHLISIKYGMRLSIMCHQCLSVLREFRAVITVVYVELAQMVVARTTLVATPHGHLVVSHSRWGAVHRRLRGWVAESLSIGPVADCIFSLLLL